MTLGFVEESGQQAIRQASEIKATRSEFADFGQQTPTTAVADGIYARYGKRVFDILGALTLILVFSPLILVIAILQIVQSGSVLFSHKRVGQDGREFGCLKFRTMVPDAEERLQALLASDADARKEWEDSRKLANDPRITGIGNTLRRTSLDELPQLLNVLKGEMSLVGPRPVTKPELSMYGSARDSYLALRPGLTGKWQVGGRNDVSYNSRVRMDQDYAAHLNMAGDLTILIQTVGVVLGATGR